MKPFTIALLALPAHVFASEQQLEARGPFCQARGAVNGQCGEIFSSGNCGGTRITEIGPDCSGTCFKADNILSIRASGDGTFGTDCAIFSDDNCQNKVGDTGNVVVVTQGGCANAVGAVGKSYQCFFKC